MSISLRFPKPDEPVAFMYPSNSTRIPLELIQSARKEAEATPLVRRRGRYRLFAVRLAGGDVGVVYSAGSSLTGTRSMAAYRLVDDMWVEE